MKRVTIIGAGPAGNYLAWKLAEQNYAVSIYEEHLEIGKPVQCTGIVTRTLRDLVPIDASFFVNQLSSVEAISPSDGRFTVPLDDFVICRTSFDSFLFNKAIAAGAKAYRGHKFVGADEKGLSFEKTILGKREIVHAETDILVGADGPNSTVSKLLNGDLLRINYYGAQATVKGDFDPGKYQVCFGDICPEFFGWVVPENKEYARVGLAVKKDTSKYFKRFLARLGISELQITDYQGGLIPVFMPQLKIEGKIVDMSIYLLGDAATQIKSTTGGGIIPSLQAANILFDCIVQQKGYLKSVKKSPLWKKLWLHLYIRRMLDLFSDNDYDRLINVLKKPSVVATLSEIDRDNPLRLVTTLLLKSPSLSLQLLLLGCQWKFLKGHWTFVREIFV